MHPRWLTASAVGAVVLASLACGGPREAGIAKNERGRTLMFVLEDGAATVDADQSFDDDTCGDLDAAEFSVPLALGDVFALEVDDEGTSARVLWCNEDYDCDPGDLEVTLDIDDTTYSGSTSGRLPISGWEGCDALEVDLAYEVEDDGEAIDVERDLVLTVPDDGTCPDLEAFVQAASPNGLGLDGCAIRGSFDAAYIARCRFGDGGSRTCVSNTADAD